MAEGENIKKARDLFTRGIKIKDGTRKLCPGCKHDLETVPGTFSKLPAACRMCYTPCITWYEGEKPMFKINGSPSKFEAM